MSDETSSVMSLIEEDPSVPSDLAPQSLSVETPALPSFVYALGRIEPRFPGLSAREGVRAGNGSFGDARAH